MMFYGYKHWTLEDQPRCFNVGKGLLRRAFSKTNRNHKWHAIVKRHGLRVEEYVAFFSNEDACAWEIENIDVMGTFSTNHSHDDPNDIGCNFTKGGEGALGRHLNVSEETRRKISVATAGMNNPFHGKKHSNESRTRMSVAHTGKKLTPEHRANMSLAHVGRPSPNKGKRMSPERLAQYVEKRRQGHR